MCYLLWGHSLCLQLGSIAPGECFRQGSEAVGMRELTWCQLSVHLGSNCWDPAPLSWLFLSQGGLFPWVFLQMSPLEQEQDMSREVAKEPLSDYRKFGWLLSPGSAAVPWHHPCRHWNALQLCACPTCWHSSCPAGAPPARTPAPAE